MFDAENCLIQQRDVDLLPSRLHCTAEEAAELFANTRYSPQGTLLKIWNKELKTGGLRYW